MCVCVCVFVCWIRGLVVSPLWHALAESGRKCTGRLAPTVCMCSYMCLCHAKESRPPTITHPRSHSLLTQALHFRHHLGIGDGPENLGYTRPYTLPLAPNTGMPAHPCSPIHPRTRSLHTHVCSPVLTHPRSHSLPTQALASSLPSFPTPPRHWRRRRKFSPSRTGASGFFAPF